MKYTFAVNQERDKCFGEFNVEVSFEAETISEVVENFELFLRGVGFHPDCIKEELGREL